MVRGFIALALVVCCFIASVHAEDALPDGYRDDGCGVMDNLEYTALRGGRIEVHGDIRAIEKDYSRVYMKVQVVDSQTGEVLAVKGPFSVGPLHAKYNPCHYGIDHATWCFDSLACTVCHGSGELYETETVLVLNGGGWGRARGCVVTRSHSCPHCTGSGWEVETDRLRIVMAVVR